MRASQTTGPQRDDGPDLSSRPGGGEHLAGGRVVVVACTIVRAPIDPPTRSIARPGRVSRNAAWISFVAQALARAAVEPAIAFATKVVAEPAASGAIPVATFRSPWRLGAGSPTALTWPSR